MSLSLEDLKGELRENYQRIEEVLTGMDNYIVKLEHHIQNQDQRISTLEGQLAVLVDALTGDGTDIVADSDNSLVFRK